MLASLVDYHGVISLDPTLGTVCTLESCNSCGGCWPQEARMIPRFLLVDRFLHLSCLKYLDIVRGVQLVASKSIIATCLSIDAFINSSQFLAK